MATDTLQEKPFGGPRSMRKRALSHHAPGKLEKKAHRRKHKRGHRKGHRY